MRVGWTGFVGRNLPVTISNVIGGALLVGIVYRVSAAAGHGGPGVSGSRVRRRLRGFHIIRGGVLMTSRGRRIGLALLVAAAQALPALPAAAQGQEGQVEQGKKLFISQGCYGCHMVGAVGTSAIGPDLSHVGGRYTPEYLVRWLRDPVSQKPTAHMPRIHLTEFEVQALAAYLASLR